jgi:glycosyltransferase involved in cell wall biosynthesis
MKQIKPSSASLLTIVVPIYNEAIFLPDYIPLLISYCCERNWKLVLVNDGSTDETGRVLEKYENLADVEIINHKLNRGYGGALKSGILNAKTPYLVTIDGDGQHELGDIDRLFTFALEKDADLVIGNRGRKQKNSWYRSLGKSIIRNFTSLLMRLPIYDLNSGFKLYRTDLAKKYLRLCPDSMAFSDIITLIFINYRRLVLEQPIHINPRRVGKSTINTSTAFETIIEILNLTMLFNPLRIFLPLSVFCILVGVVWGGPFILLGRGVSVGSMLAIVVGILFFFLGLLASQLSAIRMGLNDDIGQDLTSSSGINR